LKIIACPEPSSKGRHRRSAGDCQNPRPSGPADPRPAALPGSSSRSIPDNLRTRKPLANASRRRRPLEFRASGAIRNLSRTSRPLSGRAGAVQQRVFRPAEQKLTSLPVLRYDSGHRKRWFKNPIQSPSLPI
jgi:hypothetical protein